MKFLTDKAHKFEEKFTSKAGKLLAFWGALGGLIAMGSSIIGVIVWLSAFFVDLSAISKNTKEFKAAQEYNYFLDMQEVSAHHEEMQTVIKYGVELQETNNGDLWYFTTVKVNDTDRPIIYSANIKKKGKGVKLKNGDKVKCHIYIQNMKGVHQWIPDINSSDSHNH